MTSGDDGDSSVARRTKHGGGDLARCANAAACCRGQRQHVGDVASRPCAVSSKAMALLPISRSPLVGEDILQGYD